PLPAAAPEAGPPAPDTRTVTYSVSGSRQLFDLVSIIYTDEQGLPRTDVNVALPWNKTLVLNPGVTIESVTATSISGQLNCTITDEAGTVLVAQTNNSMIATCTG
ncbi:MAG: MmpS family transport accessory protein, partial [Mycobacterium sp.]